MFVYVSMFIEAHVYARHRTKKNSPGGGKFSENPGKYFKQLADDLVFKIYENYILCFFLFGVVKHVPVF